SPLESLSSGISTVSASPPMPVISRPFLWSVERDDMGGVPERAVGAAVSSPNGRNSCGIRLLRKNGCELIHGTDRRRPDRLHGLAVKAFPALRAKMLRRQEAHLVVHLARAVDPIAEIDVGQAGGARPRDV